jgi:hypothetical protein
MAYYFRDFTLTFYPLRLFQAREIAVGTLAVLNPYVNEGTFALPAFYPMDLLHALWPGPVAVSDSSCCTFPWPRSPATRWRASLERIASLGSSLGVSTPSVD